MTALSAFISARTPPSWQTKPLWSLFRRQKITGHPGEELLSVYRDYGVIPKSSRDDNFNVASEDLSGYQLVTEGCLVTNKMKAWQGSIAISRYRGIVSPAYYVYRPLSSEHDQFLHYLLRSEPYIALYGRISKGVRVNQWDLEHEALRNIPLMLPDIETQKAIADFLDRETARIDQLIEKKQQLIGALKSARFSLISSALTVGLEAHPALIPTGSSHLPRIPKGWVLCRLKHLAKVRGGLTLGRDVKPGEKSTATRYLRVANVQAGWLDLSDVAEIEATQSEIARYALREGDVLMNEGGDNDKLGRGAVWGAAFEPCLHQNHVFAVRPHVRHHAEWISLATNAQYARDFFYLHSNQSTNLASISKTNLEKFPIALPPMEELRRISAVVFKELERFSKISSNVALSVERLREHRSALITAAVTGQIDVSSRGRRSVSRLHPDGMEAPPPKKVRA